ncbi:TIGR00375 family protein [Mesobacillus maritimus]|uniref:TIGR00375 family protein n=1 Tax=Mesobacillus maritimus TaxID=1643336 RepID=UPI00203FD878|nr:TIGR00375 family protein [Mesobacillus maritimus]MCM3586434.1 TIGR00375 family protein [Mesobacillus maritimus]MCM3669534.1 TIGR00375 family protein [Mesobacillus maritimus]
MKEYFADLHIHIGRTKSGRAVKITGSKTLTLTNIIGHARDIKGLDIVGIIDCHSPEVLEELEDLMAAGEVIEHPDGGLLYGGMGIFLGTELEINSEETSGPIHVLCFFPTMETMRLFSEWLSNHLKNIHLSSQRVYVTGKELQHKTKELNGLFIPAHVFTPFKSLYGKGVRRSLTEVFDPTLIDGVELGLSANTKMAEQLAELSAYPFLTNSDAHSLKKIAREYQKLYMNEVSFTEFGKVLRGEEGRGVAANYGLDPLLGKYHRTVCANCLLPISEGNPCSVCGKSKIVKGVADRIAELKSEEENLPYRPPYIHQIPLDFIPGLGPKLLEKLMNHFGTEMAVLHEVPESALKEVVPSKVAELIVQARSGDLKVHAGGGGKYGKIIET